MHARCTRARLLCIVAHTPPPRATEQHRQRGHIPVYSHAEWNQRAGTRLHALRMARSGVGMRCLCVLYSRTILPSETYTQEHTRLSLSIPLCVRVHTPDRDAHGTTPTVCDVTWMSSRFGKRAGKWTAAQGPRGLLCGASCGNGVVRVWWCMGKIQHGA
jgi:hypothetical protein